MTDNTFAQNDVVEVILKKLEAEAEVKGWDQPPTLWVFELEQLTDEDSAMTVGPFPGFLFEAPT